MSTYATRPAQVLGRLADEPAATHLERVVRVSVDLAVGEVGLDVETRSVVVHASRLYERTVLTPAATRTLAAELLAAAEHAERIQGAH